MARGPMLLLRVVDKADAPISVANAVQRLDAITVARKDQ